MKTTRPPFLVLLSSSMAGLASAQSWNDTNGNWATASNWVGGALPSTAFASEARIINGNVEITTAAESSNLWIGGTGTGLRGVATLTIKDGGSLNSANTNIGPNAGSPPGTGIINVEGTGTWTIRSHGQTYIGISGGAGAVNVTGGGTVTSSGPTSVGYSVGSNTGALRISGQGSSWTMGTYGSMNVGIQNGSGVLTLEDGGTLKSSQGYSVLGLGDFNSNGTVNIGSGGAAGKLQVTLVSSSGGNSSGNINFNHNESAYVFSPFIDRNVSVEQKGTGTTILTAANTYTGTTTVSGGELKANNTTGSAFGTGNVQVNASTTLSGTGRFTGSATIDGTYAPGNSVGNLTSGSITIGATGEYEWEINKADGTAGQAAGGWDIATVNGTLTFQEGATLSIVSLGLDNLAGLATAFDDSQNYLWTVATTTGGITGADDVTIDTTGFQNSHTGTFDLTTSGNNLQLRYTANVIPEPSSLLLAAGVIVTFAGRRRRN